MRDAGYTPVPSTDASVGISSVFPGTGYDPDVVYKGNVVGTLIWGDSEFVRRDDALTQAANNVVKNKGFSDDGQELSLPMVFDPLTAGSDTPPDQRPLPLCPVVTSICTKIINVPVLTDNSYIGIEGCLGSLALASVDNNRRFVGDPSYGDPALCEILQNPAIRRKVVINILDALVAQYAGGPHFDPQFTRSIGALYVSRDPVAIDSLVLKRMEHWRAEDRDGRIDPIGKAANYIHTAALYNLGTDDPHRIQLVRLP